MELVEVWVVESHEEWCIKEAEELFMKAGKKCQALRIILGPVTV
jgi:hypothetical protein